MADLIIIILMIIFFPVVLLWIVIGYLVLFLTGITIVGFDRIKNG